MAMAATVNPLRSLVRAIVPRPLRSLVRRRLAPNPAQPHFYERAYERIAATVPGTGAIGGGDFEVFGRIELGLLLLEGVRPTDTVADLGCGIGRLAVPLIPYLQGGRYIGIDISKRMLREAARRAPGGGCKIEWRHQRTSHFDLPEASVDVMCAFSVFTHMEPEDSYRYLGAALRTVRPGGKFLFSCLPLSLPAARGVFLESAEMDLAERWSQVRNFTTTEEAMERIAAMAGWKVLHWHPGEQASVAGLPPLGQSTCVLERPK